jgi:hypothetical protein
MRPPQKKTGEAILTSNKVDFKPKLFWRQRSHILSIKGTIQQEEIIVIINIQH